MKRNKEAQNLMDRDKSMEYFIRENQEIMRFVNDVFNELQLLNIEDNDRISIESMAANTFKYLLFSVILTYQTRYRQHD